MTVGISLKFRNFAIHECRQSSPLYEFLALKIAEDQEMLELAAEAREGQPVPNLFLGAVHYLLMKGKKHPFREYYPSITSVPKRAENSYRDFVDFCREYSDDILQLLETKIVQTNEVRRCSYLYPVFSYIFQMTKKPLALIEIGTSAGLQLFVDQYSYSYGTNQVYGNIGSDVHITSEIRAGKTPLNQMRIPVVASRIGIDLHINDVNNDEDYLWLKALIWPEHHERRELFEKAANYVGHQSLNLIEGDGVALLKGLSEEIPADQVICVFHTHVANQMPSEIKEALLKQIGDIGAQRDIFHIYNNIYDRDLHLDFYLNGKENSNKVGETEGHGGWFSWEL